MLDEPTNDLDVETLELLEEILLGFKGTVLLVSHDREFMDNVVTSVLVLEGNGVVSEHVGGYSHWVEQGGSLRGLDAPAEARSPATAAPAAAAPTPVAKKKLSYKDQRELDALPAAIEGLEQRQAALEAEVSAPDFYQQDHLLQEPVVAAIAEVQAELQKAYQRWEELDSQ